MRNVFYFLKKVRLFSQNYVLFLFYFLINPTITTANVNIFRRFKSESKSSNKIMFRFKCQLSTMPNVGFIYDSDH